MFRKVINCFFLEFISTNNLSISFGKICFIKSSLGLSLLTYTSMPPPFGFRSSRKGEQKPSIRKLNVVNVSSSFVSVNTYLSTSFGKRHFNWLNVPDMKLMFRFPAMTF